MEVRRDWSTLVGHLLPFKRVTTVYNRMEWSSALVQSLGTRLAADKNLDITPSGLASTSAFALNGWDMTMFADERSSNPSRDGSIPGVSPTPPWTDKVHACYGRSQHGQ